tara:strand:- start:23109 stop:23672 length:564 start_codon:yes stop_codon:yes gene_type:complete
MANTNLKKQILSALGLTSEVIKMEWQAKLTDGTIVVSSAPELESGVDIGILTEDGTTMPLPIGSYETEEGVGFTVEEEGIVAELLTEEEEAPSEETSEEAVEEVEASSEMLAQIKSIVVDVVNAAMKDLKVENAKLKRQMKKLSDEPSSSRMSVNKFSNSRSPKQIISKEDYNNMSSLDRFNYNLKK